MRVGGFVLAALVACSAPDTTGPEGGVPFDAGGVDAKVDVAEAAACATGQTRCTDSLLGVETCDATGNWSAPAPCASQTCVNGACAGKCSQGQTQCSGNAIETCDATGNYAVSQTCAVACCNSACVDTATDTKNCGACGNACVTGATCGTGFSAFNGTQPANWNANGDATYDSGNQAAELTAAVATQAGAWVYQHALFVDTATIQFDFYAGGGDGADGLGLMLETNGPTAVGISGGGLGIAGLSGFGVELDTYDNEECMDDSSNHIAIDSLAACGDGAPTSLLVNDAPGFTLGDGAWHTVVVEIVSGAFTVTADNNGEVAAYTPTGWANASYYLGFGAGTGGQTNVHEVRNVSVTFATPHCY